eukprot:3939710-Rhodomonas_salina.4
MSGRRASTSRQVHPRGSVSGSSQAGWFTWSKVKCSTEGRGVAGCWTAKGGRGSSLKQATTLSASSSSTLLPSSRAARDAICSRGNRPCALKSSDPSKVDSVNSPSASRRCAIPRSYSSALMRTAVPLTPSAYSWHLFR